MTTIGRETATWDEVRDRLHAEGLRWTPQRRTLVEVLRRSDGHVTGAELVERCRELDPTTTPSTVYRTLDVLEGLGYLSHHHGMDGREEFHVLPTEATAISTAGPAGRRGSSRAGEADAIAGMLDAGRAFVVDRSHITISGQCAACAAGRPDPLTNDAIRAGVGHRLVALETAEPPHRGRGTHHPGAKRGPTATATPTPSPSAHLAGQAGLLRGTRCSGHRFAHRRPSARSGGISPST